ncbi:MAG: peptidoglycan DD-metalloendopeptidase family protein [Rhizobiales bacterium]|nr:peptidoglycan DD-metalloendopeptidase family protein [Hyphomicrobiales bacterium]
MLTYRPRVARGFSKTHFLISAAAALMLAGCSQSVERFSEKSSSQNPSDSDPVYTASVPRQQRHAAGGNDDDTITSRPLAGTKTYKTGKGYAYNNTNYGAPAYKATKVPQVAQEDEPAARGTAGRVTVGQGMTLYSIARANNLTVAELAAANRLKPPYSVHRGQVLRIPGASDAVTPATRTVSTKRTAGGTHDVASGETLFSLGRKYGVSPYAIADLNGFSHDYSLKHGEQVKIPSGANIALAAKTKAPADSDVADTEEIDETPEVSSKTPAVEEDLAVEKPVVAEASEEPGLGMRWPVRGKIISSYGAKPNGLKNEGINIAVPEGASVRAAESGVVAYAGNELKGYGNLVLIRHDGGYVTAYAHAKELFVKRGDPVKRGDVIAKAGQTGSVSSPQLHFEVRKGATAMDPLKFLSSSTASN